MESNYQEHHQIEGARDFMPDRGHGEYSPPIPSAPIDIYYIQPRQLYIPPINLDSSDDHTIFIEEVHGEDLNEVSDDVNIDVLVIYICVILAFIFPFAGLFYMCCFRFCCRSNPHPRKRRAYKILAISTLLGFSFYIILGSTVFKKNLNL